MLDSGAIPTRHHSEQELLRVAIVADLSLRRFPVDGYRREGYPTDIGDPRADPPSSPSTAPECPERID